MSGNFSSRLRQVREKVLNSRAEVQRLLGVSPSTWARYENGTQSPTADTLAEFVALCREKSHPLDLDWLLFGTSRKETLDEFTPIPAYSPVLSAGDGALVEDETLETWYMFRTVWLNRKGGSEGKALLTVSGDSMAPTFQNGDMVMVDTTRKAVINGHVYAVRLDREILIKRVSLENGQKVRLISDNPERADQVVPFGQGDNLIIGKVVWQAREV